MVQLLDGKTVKKEGLEELKRQIESLERPLGLTVIQVGQDPASNVYVRQKAKMAEMLGMHFQHINLPESVSQEELLGAVKEQNENDAVDGILVQMPIPRHLDAKKIQNTIDSNKDVDGLTDVNMGRLVHGQPGLVPCTPYGVMELLNYYKIPVEGKNVVIVGRSDLVGKPLAALMTNANATVTLCHSKTKNLKIFTQNAEIIVMAVGRPKMLTNEMVKNGAVIIDVGINRLEDGSLCGDVDFETVQEKASYITPVPGGVGPMTIYELAKNVKTAYQFRKHR